MTCDKTTKCAEPCGLCPEQWPVPAGSEAAQSPAEGDDEQREQAPLNDLPSWSECDLIISNHEFRQRAAAGLEGQVLDLPPITPPPTALHRFIHEYDDADPYRSDWFMHRLELVVKEAQANVQPKGMPVAWTLRETLDKAETTTTGYLWFSDPKNSAWAPLYAEPQQQAWVWNPASLAWEAVRTPWHRHSGALYAYGSTPPDPLAVQAPAPAPERDEDDQWTLDRAADLLEGYAAYIRNDGSENLQYHPYIPEVDMVAANLRIYAAKPANQSPAPGDESDLLISALAACRDAFPIPESGAPHENAWMLAMGDPAEVPDYVRAALAANVKPKGTNPNNCQACDYKRHPDGGWCYMFRDEPAEVCAKHTARTSLQASAVAHAPITSVAGLAWSCAVPTEVLSWLSAHPPSIKPRNPLTEEQIVHIYERPELAGTRHESGTAKAIAIARAIERAHGIFDVPVQHTQRATGLVDCGECLNGCPAGKCRAASKGAQP